MIQIKTKFKIGDEVRYPVPGTTYKKITCPYCKGRGIIDISPEESMGCEMCDNGIYEMEVWEQKWSSTKIVTGAVVGKSYFKKPITDVVYICIGTAGMVKTIPEHQVRYASEVEEGALIEYEELLYYKDEK